jgi:GTPase SAR1 family protein
MEQELTNTDETEEYSIAVVGSVGGKSSITQRFIQKAYIPLLIDDHYGYTKHTKIDGRQCCLSILDTVGQRLLFVFSLIS